MLYIPPIYDIDDGYSEVFYLYLLYCIDIFEWCKLAAWMGKNRKILIVKDCFNWLNYGALSLPVL